MNASPNIPYQELFIELSIQLDNQFPTVCRCPLCKTPQSLSIIPYQNGYSIRCFSPSCRFYGTAFDLYAHMHHMASFDACTAFLTRRGYSDSDMSAIKEILEEEYQHRCWWDKINAAAQRAASLESLVPKECAAFDPGPLIAHVGLVKGSDIIQNIVIPKTCSVHDWYIVLPAWTSYHTWCGYYFMNQKGMWYAPIKNHASEQGYILLDSVTPNHASIYITGSLPLAWALHSQAYHHGYDSAVTCISRRLDKIVFPIPVQQRIYVIKSTELDTLRTALNDTGSRCVWVDSLFSQKVPTALQLKTLFQQSHPQTEHALVEFLSKLPVAHIASLLDQLDMTKPELQRLIRCSKEPLRQKLASFETKVLEAKAIFEGKTILHNEDGWFLEGRQLRISNTAFVIHDITIYKHQPNQVCMARGVIYQKNLSFSFHAPLEEVQHNTENWLQQEVMEHYGHAVFIAPRWKHKLFHVALAFHEPKTTYVEHEAGWVDEYTLMLPQCRIAHGVVEAQPKEHLGLCNGRNLLPMSETSQRSLPDFLVYDARASDFWVMVLYITYSIFARRDKLPVVPCCWYISSESAKQCVEALFQHAATDIPVAVFDVQDHTLESLQQVSATLHEQTIFPLLSVSSWTHATPVYGSWIASSTNIKSCIPVSPIIAFGIATAPRIQALLAMPHVSTHLFDFDACTPYWNLMVHFWAYLQKRPIPMNEQQATLKQLGMSLMRWLSSLGYEYPPAVQTALHRISWNNVPNHGPKGLQLLKYFIEAHRYDLLSAQKTETHVNIIHTHYAGSMAQLQLPALSHDEAKEMLLEVSSLDGIVIDNQIGYSIPLYKWDEASRSLLTT